MPHNLDPTDTTKFCVGMVHDHSHGYATVEQVHKHIELVQAPGTSSTLIK